jgi:feruloyl esterase
MLGRGYAVSVTDTGHSGGATDARWALHHPEKVIDYGYRAIHETAIKARAIVERFYAAPPRRAYFHSCSNGGRQALIEAQRYPADYDGIIAGAPANYWTHLLSAAIWEVQALGDPASWIPPAKLPAIENAALAACDALDGVKDGVIGDPSRCRFDPSTLLCKGAEADACLTAAQVAALAKILGGPKTSKGIPVFPGKAPGGMLGGNAWRDWITGSAQGFSAGHAFGMNFFANMVFEDPAWDYRTFNFDRDLAVADRKLAAVLNATDPDLGPFRRRGGKLIVYHGWSDAAIAPQNAVDYYNSVVAQMGARPAADVIRLFMVPGMLHCGGGPGATDFGQGAGPASDAEHDINAALEHWVEQGQAPAQLIAAGNDRTRPLCPYPQVAQWTGKGSTYDAANFVCKTP